MSYIKDSYFIEDQNLIEDKYGNGKTNNIILWGIHGLNILGNSFENNNLAQAVAKRGIGIITSGSSFNVEPYCDPNITPCSILRRNVFKNLYYGISCYEGVGSNNIIKINDNVFTNTYRSILLSGTHNAVVTSNSCAVPDMDLLSGISPYGIYINSGRDFKIEENKMTRATSSPMINGARGIIVHNTGPVNNEIYMNECYNLSLSFQSQCFNSGLTVNSDVGLKFFCNISETGSQYNNDFWINNLSSCAQVEYSVIGAPMPRVGIAKHQRRPNLDEDQLIVGDEHFAADDRFTLCHETLNPWTKVDINNEDNYWLSWYYNGDGYTGDNENWNPVNHLWDNVGHYPEYQQDTEPHCPSKLIDGNGTITELLSVYNATKIKYNSAKIILNVWKDGGNINLDEEVETTQSWEAYQQFNELMGESPYLSDEVLLEIIDNPVFTAQMVKLLIIANPQSVRNNEIMEALENRVPAMPQSYIDAIRNSEDGTISQLEILDADVASYNHALDIIEQNIKRKYRDNHTDESAKNDLLTFMSNGTDLFDKFELAVTYLEFGEYTNMQNTLDFISNNYELSSELQDNLAEMQTILDIAISVQRNDRREGSLIETQIESLETIMNNDAPYIGAMALSLLKYNDVNYVFNEQVDNLTVNSSRLMPQPSEEPEEDLSCKYNVYPNPALDYTTLSYDCSKNNIHYLITDIQGRLLVQKMLQTVDDMEVNEEFIDLNGLNPGTYQIIVRSETGIEWIGKLIIK